MTEGWVGYLRDHPRGFILMMHCASGTSITSHCAQVTLTSELPLAWAALASHKLLFQASRMVPAR